MKSIDVYRLSLVKEKEVPYSPIGNPDDITDILKCLGLDTAAEEYFYLICVNAKGAIAGIHEVSHGDLTSSAASGREIYKRALLNNAAAVIFAHNHPSSSTKPSEEDIRTTIRLVEIAELLNIKALDHIIIGAEGYFSFKKEGLI